MTKDRAQTDARDMIAVHDVMRKALRAPSDVLGEVRASSAEDVEAVGLYYDTVLSLIHAHHDAEDALIWPRLTERTEDSARLIKEMEAQHRALDPLMNSAEESLRRWRAEPDEARRDQLTEALQILAPALTRHLDSEEAEVIPLIEAHITPEEWAEMPGYAMRAMEGPGLMVALGLVRDQMTDEHRKLLDENMPPPLREAWLSEGRAMFESVMMHVRA